MREKLGLFITVLLLSTALCVTYAQQSQSSSGTSSQSQTQAALKAPPNYPGKNIEIINPFGPGSTTEAYLRLMMSWVEKEYKLKNNFIIVGREGGGGLIGWTAIAKAKPDGLTIGMVHSPMLQLPISNPDCKFTKDSFDSIINLVTDPGAVAVLSSSSANSLKDFVELARQKPGKVTVACTGLSTSEARAISQIEKAAGVKFKLIPYSGSEVIPAVLGGHVDAMATNVGNIMTQLKENSVKLLGVGTSERSSRVPNIPTYKEQGFDVEQYSMRGIAAPKGLDPQILGFLREAFSNAQKDPETIKKAEALMIFVDQKTPDQVKAMYDRLDKDLRAIWAVAPWQ